MDTYKLRCGLWEAECLPRWGMNTIALRYAGQDILRCPTSEDQLHETEISPLLYGQPLLLPANRTRDGKFTFEGKEYQLPLNETETMCNQHGQLFVTPFTVLEHTDTTIVGQLKNGGYFYPFPFTIRITDTLTEEGYTRTLVLTNTGSTPMPYTLGFHTAFVEPKELTVPLKSRNTWDEKWFPTGQTEPEVFEKSPIVGKITGYYVSAGNTAILDDTVYRVSDNFDHWILYNGGGGKGFVCVEPQCGAVNGLNHPGQHRILAPGESETFTMTITKGGTAL